MSNSKSKNLIALEAYVGLSGPSILGAFGVIGYEWRYIPVVIVCALVFWRLFYEGYSWRDLGVQVDNFHGAAWAHVIPTVIGLAFLFWFATDVLGSQGFRSIGIVKFFFAIFISFLQELVFRSFLIKKLRSAGIKKWNIIFISAFTFASIHLFFDKFQFEFIGLCFIYGIAVSYLYYKYRNLLWITASHAAMNLAAFHLNLF